MGSSQSEYSNNVNRKKIAVGDTKDSNINAIGQRVFELGTIPKVSINLSEYLRLQGIEREYKHLQKKQDRLEVVEPIDCYGALKDNLYNELEVLYTKYRGCFIWDLSNILCGIIAFYINKYLEEAPISFEDEEFYNDLKYISDTMHHYFTKGDVDRDDDVESVKIALELLQKQVFSLWT